MPTPDCSQCGYPANNCQCPPPPPVKPLSGWQCPVCRRVFAPFVPQCSFCSPRRNYEVLDKYVPRDGEGDPAMSTTLDLPKCERCGNNLPLVGDPVFQTETGHVCGRCTTTLRHGMTVGLPEPVAHATVTVPAWTTSGSCEHCGMDLTSTTSHTTDGKDRLCEGCFTRASNAD